MKENIVAKINIGSLGEELGFEIGDKLISINGQEVKDIIDFLFLTADEYLEIELEKQNGEIWEIEVEKEYDEELGISFSNPLMDEAKRCSNNCIFCFIDQMPPGMREPLYFKDDDSRLSFIQGNFVTLTNVNYDQLKRIIDYRIYPINVSVHTTNPELRVKILKNRFSGDILDKLKYLANGEISMNGQIVLMPNINDGTELERTIDDLTTLYPYMNSVAVVPIGLTKFRDGLEDVKPFDSSSSSEVIEQIELLQNKCLEKLGTRFVFPADEFYMMANVEVPEEDWYEGYVQEENGVGLIRKFMTEFLDSENLIKQTQTDNSYYVVTGKSALKYINKIADTVNGKVDGMLEVEVLENDFFGPLITVSGLLTGADMIKHFEGKNKKTGVIIPESMLNYDGLTLDDMTLEELSKKIGMPISVSKINGNEFVKLLKELI